MIRQLALVALAALVPACLTQAESTTVPVLLETSTTTSSTTTTTTTIAPSTTADIASGGVTPPGDLMVIGDWGSGTLPQGAVAGAMARHAETNRVAAILTTGDNFYSSDAEFLLQPLDWAFQQGIPFWVTWGNHDVETPDRIEAVEEAFDSPPRWSLHEWGAVDVVILDSNQVGAPEQVEFLMESLASSDDPTAVVFHHPALSCSTHGDTKTVLGTWVPQFDDDVVLVLSGHDHNYQRFVEPSVTYVVSGGGGRPLYELKECPVDHPVRVAGAAVHHFLVLTQGEDEIVIEVVDVNGNTIDSFDVSLD